jgi:hypothetical protein
MGKLTVAALGVAILAAAAEDRPAGALTVYVTVADPDPAPPIADVDPSTALKLKRESVRMMRRALQKRLEQEVGKNRASWPPEKQAELLKMEDAEALAEADYEYRRSDPHSVFEVASALTEALQTRHVPGHADHARLADREADADLIVTVAATRTGKTYPTQSRPDRCYVLFTVGPGTTISAARFAQVPSSYQLKKLGLNAWKIAGPRPDAPVVYLEAYNGGGREFGCASGAAAAAAAAVDRFAEDNYAVLAAK